MSSLFSGKAIIIAIGISLLITGLTYFVQLDNPISAEFFPWKMQYNIIYSAEQSTSLPAAFYGWPFAYMLGNSAVISFSTFAFILDMLLYLVLSFLVLWLLLRNDRVYDYVTAKPKAKQ